VSSRLFFATVSPTLSKSRAHTSVLAAATVALLYKCTNWNIERHVHRPKDTHVQPPTHTHKHTHTHTVCLLNLSKEVTKHRRQPINCRHAPMHTPVYVCSEQQQQAGDQLEGRGRKVPVVQKCPAVIIITLIQRRPEVSLEAFKK